jgi:hypothetical protein
MADFSEGRLGSGPSQNHPSQPIRRRDALSAFGKPTKVQMGVGLKMKHWFRHRPSQVLPTPAAKGYAAGISALGVLPTYKSDF